MRTRRVLFSVANRWGGRNSHKKYKLVRLYKTCEFAGRNVCSQGSAALLEQIQESAICLSAARIACGAVIFSNLGEFMIVEYTRYKIDETRRAAFLNDYRRATQSLSASKNCLAHELTQCTEDEAYYVLRIEWDSEEGHLKGFRNSAEFKSFFPLVKPYVNDIEEMRHYRLTGVAGRKE